MGVKKSFKIKRAVVDVNCMCINSLLLPEMERLMQDNNPAYLDFVKVRVYTMAPMKPRTAQKIPIEDIIWISSIMFLVSPENRYFLNALTLVTKTNKRQKSMHCIC